MIDHKTFKNKNQIKELQKEITWKEREFELAGKKDWSLLSEINDLKKQLQNIDDSCNLDGECQSCGS
jgi:septal ring factor EnvC (AmiA/AmiB activator)